MTVWIIGGTSESVTVAAALAAASLPCVVTVTTPDAVSLYRAIPGLSVLVLRVDSSTIGAFCQEKSVRPIVDASHPHAALVSRTAIDYSRLSGIPYIRYERPRLEGKTTRELDSVATLVRGDYLAGRRVLLTLGAKALPLFREWHGRATLFTRLLPVVHSIERAIEAGFPGERIIALRPPVSAALERALWKQWEITLVVTKASGVPGGEDVKRAVAGELGIDLVTIARPQLDYPLQSDRVDAILHFCQLHHV